MSRPTTKKDQIVAFLRDAIVDGRFAPGARIPTREALIRQFATSKSTVQAALDELLGDGYACARGPAGTFVTETPPHLCRYAVVYPWRPSPNCRWSRFWKALDHESRGLHVDGTRELVVHYGGHGSPASADLRELLRDVETHKVAGLVFVSEPYLLVETAVVKRQGLPRVGVMAQPFGAIPARYVDWRSFVDCAVSYLASRGRRRLGLLWMAAGTNRSMEQYFQEAAARHGMVFAPYCSQLCSFSDTGAAANVAHLLMKLPPAERPDALVLADDNLVTHAQAGLLSAGVVAPQDLDVVAHANFPTDEPKLMPMRRLGFDTRHLLMACIRAIDAQRQGQPVPPVDLLPAVWEEELAAVAPAADEAVSAAP